MMSLIFRATIIMRERNILKTFRSMHTFWSIYCSLTRRERFVEQMRFFVHHYYQVRLLSMKVLEGMGYGHDYRDVLTSGHFPVVLVRLIKSSDTEVSFSVFESISTTSFRSKAWPWTFCCIWSGTSTRNLGRLFSSDKESSLH